MNILSVCELHDRESAVWWRIWNIAELLKSRGHDVRIVHYVKKSSYKKLEDRQKGDGMSFVATPRSLVHVKHLMQLAKDDYDVVYANTCRAAFGAVFGKLARVPLILDMHGGIVEEYLLLNDAKSLRNRLELLLNKLIDRINMRFSDRIICVSKKMIEYLHKDKEVPLEKMSYVTNGIDLELFKCVSDETKDVMRCQLGLGNRSVFGYIGNLQKWQGVENLVEAAKRSNDNNVAFLIVGGSGQSGKNIVFVPKVPRHLITNYYSLCDVLVLPRPRHIATEIAAPTKFAEYAGIGKPILTTNVGDAADFVREYNCGIVVEDNRPENLLKGINEFKSKSISELKSMGKNSRKLAEEQFDWNKISKNLLKAVENISLY